MTMDLTQEESALIHACRYAAKLKTRHLSLPRNSNKRATVGKQILDYNNIIMGITRRLINGPDRRDKP